MKKIKIFFKKENIPWAGILHILIVFGMCFGVLGYIFWEISGEMGGETGNKENRMILKDKRMERGYC